MDLTATGWHILCLCLFPFLNIAGISGSIFLSASKNRLLLSSGVIFSAGVLLSVALVHMLPHSVRALEGQIGGGGEDSHNVHEEGIENVHDDQEELVVDDHVGHDHRDLRIMYLEQQLRLLQEDGHDDHGSHDHAFPWAYTFFSIAFIFLLCVEASMERFIDVYFVGKKASFFHCHGCHDEPIPDAEVEDYEER